jgi:hypothetical protein
MPTPYAWQSIRGQSGAWTAKAGLSAGAIYPPKDFHVIQLSYQADQLFYGYLFGYGVPEAALIRFSQDKGKCEEVCRHKLSEGFAGDFGDGVFVTATGGVVSLLDGEVFKKLAFQSPEDQ